MIYKIFVSSVQKELRTEREAVKDAVENDPLLSEYFYLYLFEKRKGAKSHSARQEYTGNAADCDIYMGIFGNEYGRKGEDGISPVEREYNKASGKCVYIFIKGENDRGRENELIDFMVKIKDENRGHCYKRFETISELQGLVKNSLLDFLKEQGVIIKGNYEDAMVKDAELEDISIDKIEWFLNTAKTERGLKIFAKDTPEDLLKQFDLVKDESPTAAAILLFGKNPQRFFRAAEINCAHFKGVKNEKPFISQQIYEGTLFDQIDSGVRFVLSGINQAVIQKRGRADFERPFEIPEFVVTEAITNAVVHRNYAVTGSVQVGLYSDRLEIWNPGRLVSGITLKDLKSAHASRPRNPRIAEIMFLAGYIQKRGTGIDEMMRQCKLKGLPEPEFRQTTGDFVAAIRKDIFTEEFLRKAGFNERQIQAVIYVKQNGSINNKEFQAECKASKRTATRDLEVLIKSKVLKKTGKTGTGVKYVLG